MDIDYKAAGFWWQVLITVINLLGWAYVLLTGRQKANASAIEQMRDQLKEELNEMDDRLIRVEKDIEHLPTHDHMAALHSRINETSESLKHIDGKLNQIDRTTQMINEYLIDKGK